MNTTNDRYLTPHEREVALRAMRHNDVAPSDVCDLATERCLLTPWDPAYLNVRGPRSLIATVALRGNASGITLGTRVFIRRELFGPQGELDLELVVHETAHVAQYLRDGTLSFLTRYLAEYQRNLRQGMSDYDAYRAISYEEEAFRVGYDAHKFA